MVRKNDFNKNYNGIIDADEGEIELCNETIENSPISFKNNIGFV